MPYRERIEQFKENNSSLTFACISDRQDFAKELEKRAFSPRLIDQSSTPLCGPAAFMFCVANERPEAYVNYVLDLAEKGEGKLGHLLVKPSDACRNSVLAEKVHPVDWVALASLRDSSNKMLRMKRPSNMVAGITMGGALAAWFTATGWFHGVNHAFYQSSKRQSSFKHLLNINQHGHGYICLLIRSAIVSNSLMDTGFKKLGGSGTPKTFLGTPDHWIVLDGRLSIDQKEYLWSDMPNRKELMHKPMRLNFWHWGGSSFADKPCCSIDDRIPNITPAQFLPYYYGYVSAAIK